MELPNPFAPWYMALFPVLLASYYLTYRNSKFFIRNRLEQVLFSIALVIATWLFLVINAGLITRSFHSAMTIGSILLLVASSALEYFCRGKQIDLFDHAPSNRQQNINYPMWISGGMSTILIYYLSVNGNFHDEGFINGHKAIIAQFQNGYFPPKNLLLPAIELNYHYAFNLICAAITAISRCSVDQAIDFFTTVSWLYCWIGLWLIGEKLFSSQHAGFFVAACTLLGGGLGPLMGILLTDFAWDIQLTALFDMKTGIVVNPPLVSYFFQHPFAAGLPLTISILLLAMDTQFKDKNIIRVAMVILFVALYYSNTVLFVTLFPTLFFYQIVYKKQKYAYIPFILTIVILLAGKSGLLLSGAHSSEGSVFTLRFWPAISPIVGIGGWYAGTFGFLMIFSLIGVFYLKQMKPLFIYIVIISASIPIFITYKHTWDIVKFATVAGFYMGILSGGALGSIMESRRGKIFAIAGFVGCTFAGFVHAGVFVYKMQFENKYCLKYIPVNREGFSEAISFLRTSVKNDEMIFCDPAIARDIAVLGGLPVIYDELPFIARAFGLPEGRIERYHMMTTERSYSIDDFKNFNVKWILDDDKNGLDLSNKIQSGDLVLVKTFKKVKLFNTVLTASPDRTLAISKKSF